MKRSILNQNADARTQNNVYVDQDTLVTETVQDCSPIIEHNKQRRNEGRNTRANGYLAASVPVALYCQWKKEWQKNHSKNWDWKTYAVMKINSRDFSELRTTDMKL